MPLSVLTPRTVDPDHGIEADPRKVRGEGPPKAPRIGFRSLMRHAKQGAHRTPRPVESYLQRCAVRVRYTKGGSLGKWKSHAKYITRKNAGQVDESGVAVESRERLSGFNATSDDVNVTNAVGHWHHKKDELFFRVIISPEFGDRIDLKKHVRDTMAAAEVDLGTKLEWVGVAHFDTDNPHVHVVLRGRKDDGTTLRIDPEYVKEGFRKRASEAATNQLGFRDEHDMLEQQRREVSQHRFTGLDRMLLRRVESQDAEGFHVRLNPAGPGLSERKRATENHLWQRVASLEQMGLAHRGTDGECVISAEFENSLRAMQRTLDRQKITHEFGVLASDPKMRFRSLKPSEIDKIEGRVLVHGQNEASGSNYMMIETIEGEVLQVPHVLEIIKMRRQHGMQPGSFVRIKGMQDGTKRTHEIEDYGSAVALLQDAELMDRFGSRFARTIPADIGGWLGDLRSAAEKQANTPRL